MTREEAIKSLNTLRESINGVFDYNCRSQCTALGMAIEALKQEPKTGHWIRRNAFLVPWKCSECNYESERYDNYCPNCGARMESENEQG